MKAAEHIAEREAFEAWYRQSWGYPEHAKIAQDARGQYTGAHTRESWVIWQAGAAWQRTQSAPAVERDLKGLAEILKEAADVLEDVGESVPDVVDRCKNWRWPLADELSGFACILAAQQRTQAAGVPEWADAQIGAVVWRYIDRMTDICTVDPAERILEQFVAEVRPIMLAAAPAQPASPAQPEVQRLREAAQDVIKADDWWKSNEDSPKSALAHFSRAAVELRAALAASTGQEVKP